MRIKSLVAAMAAVASLAPIAAQAQAQENPWMVRVRAVDLLWNNGQTGIAQAANIKAKDQWIPEFDVSYFFTKNIAAELVLTWPQQVNITANGADAGKISALPPSLLAQYHFTDLGAFKPYVGAGLNFTKIAREQMTAGGSSVTLSNNSAGAAFQAGVDIPLNKQLSLNFDVKKIQIKSHVYVGGADQGTLKLDPVLVGVGVGYRF